jgi:hypothetical protein
LIVVDVGDDVVVDDFELVGAVWHEASTKAAHTTAEPIASRFEITDRP